MYHVGDGGTKMEQEVADAYLQVEVGEYHPVNKVL